MCFQRYTVKTPRPDLTLIQVPCGLTHFLVRYDEESISNDKEKGETYAQSESKSRFLTISGSAWPAIGQDHRNPDSGSILTRDFLWKCNSIKIHHNQRDLGIKTAFGNLFRSTISTEKTLREKKVDQDSECIICCMYQEEENENNRVWRRLTLGDWKSLQINKVCMKGKNLRRIRCRGRVFS